MSLLTSEEWEKLEQDTAKYKYHRDVKPESFSEALETADIKIHQSGIEDTSTHSIVMLLNNKNNIQNIEEHLKSRGHTEFEFIGNGTDGFALRTNQGTIIRFDKEVNRVGAQRAPIKQVLQADSDFTSGGIRYEVVESAPSLDSLIENGTMTKIQANQLAEKVAVGLAKDGYSSLDIGSSKTGFRLDNIGLKADGTPVIIDPGSKVFNMDEYITDVTKAGNINDPRVQARIKEHEYYRSQPDPEFDWASELKKIEGRHNLASAKATTDENAPTIWEPYT
tara:strand:- start:1532 stop:2368 length:837 start_codon:yes stop_codon:yes gene_type:complete